MMGSKDRRNMKTNVKEGNAHIHLTARYVQALEYAIEWHGYQHRKSTEIPYISHPLGVSSLILEAMGDEDQAIAGLLHDIPEDCGGEPRLVEIQKLFGDRVAELVRGCSDSLTEDPEVKAPWRERKEEHLRHLAVASADLLLVTGADKVHNGRSIATDKQSIGDEIWRRFNSDKASIIWYYDSVLAILEKAGITKAIVNPLKAAIEVMKADSPG